MTIKGKIAVAAEILRAWSRRRPGLGIWERVRELTVIGRDRLEGLQALPSVIADGRAFQYAANAALCLSLAIAADWAYRFAWPTPTVSALLHLLPIALLLSMYILQKSRTARLELAERVWFAGLAVGASGLPFAVYLLDMASTLAFAQLISGIMLLLFIYPLRQALLCFVCGGAYGLAVVIAVWLTGHPLSLPTANVILLLNIPVWIFLRIYFDRETKDKVFAVKVTTSTIAHEMRTPMFSISASCEAQRQQFNRFLVKTLTADQRENPYTQMTIRMMSQAIDRIEDEAVRMNGSLNLLLQNASSPKSIPPDTTLVPSLEAAVSKYVSTYPFFGDADLEKIQMVVKGDFAVYLSPSVLEHVVTNLLKNALHSIQKANKGKIVITIEKQENEKFNIMRFKDTGSGMSKSTLSKIFVPFFTTKSNGTGLGLPFTRNVLTLFGAEISADSVENEFAEFSIRFPNVDHRITHASNIPSNDNHIG